VKSLQRDLHAGLMLAIVLLLGAFWLLGHQALYRLMEGFVGTRLQHDTEAILASLELDSEGKMYLNWSRLMPVYHQPFSGHYYVIQVGDERRVVSRSLWDFELEVPKLSLNEEKQWDVEGPDGQHLLAWARTYKRHGLEFTLMVAENVTTSEETLVKYEWIFVLVSTIGLAFLLLIQRWVVRRGFHRLKPVYEDIRALEKGELLALTEEVPTELAPLVKKFNQLLKLMDQRLDRSRNAVGNLAHALKTPLALLTQYMERPELDVLGSVRIECEEQIHRIRMLMDRELKRARLAGAGGAGQYFEPAQEIPVMLTLLERMHAEKRINVDIQFGSGAAIEVDREDMLELLGNLLDNAFKWANKNIRLSCYDHDTDIELVIEDDGPGCSEAELEQLTQRGVRLDEETEGHGLGLSIVKDIVKLYDASLEFGISPDLGGLRASVVFPKH
jgi:signal transduction histidine kinase